MQFKGLFFISSKIETLIGGTVLKLVALNVLPALLAYAAARDFISMKIPNWISVGLVGCFFLFAVFCGIDVAILANHLGAALLVLVVAFVLFSCRWIGGGDAKLMAATALWVGLNPLLIMYWLISAFWGGALTVIILVFRRFPLFLPPWGWALRLHDKENGVPYGIALAAAGLFLYPETLMFDVLMNGL